MFGKLRAFYRRYLEIVLRLRWPLVAGYLAISIGLLYVYLPRMGTEIFPDANAPLIRIRLRAAAGTRIEETERQVLKALEVIKREAGPDNVLISSDFMGVQPPSYPVNLIHLFTSGPGEAIIQVSLKANTPRGEDLRERLRRSLQKELPGSSVSFEAADIVSQVMGFGSPTPVEVAVLGSNLQDNSAYAQKLRAQVATVALPTRSAICSGTQLPDDGYQHQPRTCRTVWSDHGGRGTLGCAGYIVIAIHATELLARPEFRTGVSDSGGASAESNSERGFARKYSSHEKRAARNSTGEYRDAETWNDAGTD